MGEGELTAKDDLLLQSFLRGESQVEASARSGMSVRTVRRRASRPAFTAALKEARDETVRRTSTALADSAARAVATLADLMDDVSAPPTVRRAAARDVLQMSLRVREQVDLVERVRELEAALNGEPG